MARRPAVAGSIQSIGGGGGPSRQNHLNGRNNKGRRGNGGLFSRFVLLGGLCLVALCAYLYSQALRTVSLGDGYVDRNRDMAMTMMGHTGGSGGHRGRKGRLKKQKTNAPKKKKKTQALRERDFDDAELDPISKMEESGISGFLSDAFGGGGDPGSDEAPEEPAFPSRVAIEEASPTPPWWMENDPDDSFERIYLNPSEKAKYKNLRNLGAGGDVNKGKGIKHYYNPMCRHYRFDESMLPTVSVIMTTQNEPDDWIALSAESILARTPPDLLVDLIIVDDNGVPGHNGLPANIRKGVDESEWDRVRALSPKVKVIKHDDREGCARSRLAGARVAQGEVLMFVDSHIEVTSATWYHHLVIPIVENPRTLSMQTIDVIDDLGSKDYGGGVGPLQYGIVNREFWFGYQADRFGDYGDPTDADKFTDEELEERKKQKYVVETPHNREPYETPFGPGSLFAIRADEFWRLGGYDEGLFVWGGENTEMAFKTWMCGGRMLMVPCSRVGHMYRQHKEKDGRGALSRWPPTLPRPMTDRLGCSYKNGTYVGKFLVLKHPADNFTRITVRNNMRVMEGWVGDHPAKRAYYTRIFGQEQPKPEFQRFIDDWKADPAARKQMRIKEENKCHDFAWWDKYVFMRLTGRHHPWHPENKKYEKVSCGNHKAKSCDQCPQGHGAEWCNGECAWCGDKCMSLEDKDLKTCQRNKRIGERKKVANDGKADAESSAKKAEKGKKKGTTRHLQKRKRAQLSDVEGHDPANELTMSVVLPCGFEHDYFARTAESVFYETPAEVLKEIVIVDDASDPPLEGIWPADEASKFGVKYVRLDEPAGLIGAKQAGAEAASGDVIVFFDCHVKPAPGYWVPYVAAVNENYRRVVVPTITNLDVDSWEEKGRPDAGGGGMSKCYLTFDAEFKWTTDDTPYVPIMSGGLLAIGRKWFFEIGGYDAVMKGWGGENLDQSLRIWTCGGEIVTAPESYVAHMWRDGTAKTKAKYKVGGGDAIRNRARAMKAHLGPWYEKTLTFPSFKEWRGKELNTSSITNAFSNLKCENFEWYLNRFKNIYQDAGLLPAEVFQIEAVSSETPPLCLELKTMRWTNYGTADEVVLKECASGEASAAAEARPVWWHGSNRRKEDSGGSSRAAFGGLRAWNTDQCVDGRNPRAGEMSLKSYTCNLDSGLEAYLRPIDEGREEHTLTLGPNGQQCVTAERGSLKIVECKEASLWRTRNAFRPIEYELLSSNSKAGWKSVS